MQYDIGSQGFRASSANLSSKALDAVRTVDAKVPALLFKQQLTAYVEKIFGIIRENLKKDLSPLVSSCIEAPRTSNGSLSHEQSNDKSPSAGSWHDIINCLNRFLNMLKENYVPPILVQKIFTQVFQYINVQLFNSLLSHKECCTFSNGEYLKYGLAKLETWCGEATEEYAFSSWDELKHVRQAVGLLVINEKTKISYDGLTNELCPILSAHQLYRICTLFGDANDNTRGVSADANDKTQGASADVKDKKQGASADANDDTQAASADANDDIQAASADATDDTKGASADVNDNVQSVSADVISSLKLLMTDGANDDCNSFLLDDNSSIPFLVDEISSNFLDKSLSRVKPPAELLENSAFQFLQD